MAATVPGRSEVDTSRAFTSVKEAVAVFGERIQFRPSAIAAHGDRLNIITEKKKNPRSNYSVTIIPPNAKPEVSDGFTTSGILTRECHSKAISVSYNDKQGGTSSNNNPAPLPVQRVTTRSAPEAEEDVPMYLVPSSPPFFASSPSLANDDDEFEEQDHQRSRDDEEAADLAVLSSIKKLEEEAARTRHDVAQLRKRVAEMELAMATLNAKLHRALSKLAHMEADKAAAERAGIEQRGRGDVAAVALWAAEEHRRRAATTTTSSRPPLGHLMRFGEEQEVARPVARRKVQKRKPIVPLVFPLINDLLFSKKKRVKDKESVYMKELYSLLRLS